MELVDLVKSNLQKHDTTFRKAIPIEKQVALSVWRLATGNSCRTISKAFGIGKSTVVKITREFCSELCELSLDLSRFLTTGIMTKYAMEQFKKSFNCVIPQCVGAIDGTHIFIKGRRGQSKYDYYSRKQCYLINTQTVFGANLCFMDVATGFPGSMHDSSSGLRVSSLYERAENNEILKGPTRKISNEIIRPLILGDSGYPLNS